MTAPAGLMSATEVAENIRDILAHIDAQAAEIERLATALKIANANHEHFERHWYLRGDEIERLRAVLAAAKGLNAESEEYEFEEGTGRGAANAYWEGLDDALDAFDDPADQAALDDYDRVIAQADAALGTER